MAKYKIGDDVINVNTKEKGVVKEVLPIRRGKQYYTISINGNDRTESENNLIADVNLTDPFEKTKRGIFSTYDEFLKNTTAYKIHNTSNSNISTLKSSKTIFKPYQFKPLLKLLNSPKRRLLVADEVGLGKTIEAGHIMLELKARRELRTALIVCPKSLREKWQVELEDKFNLRFKIYEKVSHVIDDLKASNNVLGIINYDKIRTSDNTRATIQDYLLKNGKMIDLLICDEAHRLRNHTTLNHRGIKEIIQCTRAALFLTATPVMLNNRNLYYLLNLLDEQEYNNVTIFENALSVNRPFITAISQLNNGEDLKIIADELRKSIVKTTITIADESFVDESTIEEIFAEIPLYKVIVENMMTKENDDKETRVQLQSDLSSLSKMNNIFSRTRKREVTQDWSQAERNPQTRYIKLHEEERELFDMVLEDYAETKMRMNMYGEMVLSRGNGLGLVQKKQQMASSVYAYMNEKSDLASGYDAFADKPDAKFEELLEIVDEVVNNQEKKLIVFARFHKTLMYLQTRLKSKGLDSLLIYGATGNRAETIQEFRDSTTTNILLSSEVGGEGLDMQFCDAMVNYDLPWNPMVVEQRIGRIDRFGQKSEKVNIYNLIVEDSIQEDIYKRLLDRIEIFRGSIGDLEAILDKELENNPDGYPDLRHYFNSLDNDLYDNKLSREERNRKLDDIAKAIITEKKNAEEISEKITNTLTADVTFRNEIAKILKNKLYITEKELVAFIRQLISKKLQTCWLEPVDMDRYIFKFCIPKSKTSTLRDFLVQYEPKEPDWWDECAKFRNSILDENELLITFNQEAAYENSKLIFINAYHPLIIAALKYFEQEGTKDANTFNYKIKTDLIPNGSYTMAVYELQHEHVKFGTSQIIKTLYPFIYNNDSHEILSDSETVRSVWGEAQERASISNTQVKFTDDEILDMKFDFHDAVEEADEQIFKNEQRKMQSVIMLDKLRTVEYFDNQIKHQKRIVEDTKYRAESPIPDIQKKALQVLPAQKGRLRILEEQKERELKRLEETTINRKSSVLISLSQITVI